MCVFRAFLHACTDELPAVEGVGGGYVMSTFGTVRLAPVVVAILLVGCGHPARPVVVSGAPAPVISQNVGAKSVFCANASMRVPGFTTPGQRTISGM